MADLPWRPPLPVMFNNVNIAKISWNYIIDQGIFGEREREKTRQLKNGKKNEAVAEKPHLCCDGGQTLIGAENIASILHHKGIPPGTIWLIVSDC